MTIIKLVLLSQKTSSDDFKFETTEISAFLISPQNWSHK